MNKLVCEFLEKKTAIKLEIGPYDSPTAGMVSLGVGARSYTRNFHYSSEYAVGRKGVKDIIHSYNPMTSKQFSTINFRTDLSEDEQKLFDQILIDYKQICKQEYKPHIYCTIKGEFTKLPLYLFNIGKLYHRKKWIKQMIAHYENGIKH